MGGSTAVPRKIAHLTTVDLSLRYLLLAQIEGSLAAGDEVIGISARGPDVPFLEQHGLRFVELEGSTRSMSLRGDLRAARSLWRTLRAERPDVLHTHNPKPGIYGRILGRLAGVPLVVHTTHGLYAAPDDRLAKRVVVYGLEAVASRFSHVELVQSSEDLDLMRRWRIAPRRKLRLLGNGVDLRRFAPADEAARRAARAALGLQPDDVVVGLVARLVAEKGIPELVAAVAQLGSPFRLLLVGPHDPAKADALPEAVLADARAAGAVLAGHREDVDRLYAAMDVFCLPSHREGFPRAAMEAAANALPVVASDIRGCRQVVEPGVTGTLVPPRDPAALARALQRYADPDRRAAEGAAGRAKAIAEFDEDEVVARVRAAYDGAPG
jgi:glycosyltransferase involved in cell wall biosynthesis